VEGCRGWQIGRDGVCSERCLAGLTIAVRCHHAQNEYSQFCAPLTSFDWSETSPNLIGTSSIDTTCSIWDLNVCCVRLCGLSDIHRLGKRRAAPRGRSRRSS
jgi:hypothetical protein